MCQGGTASHLCLWLTSALSPWGARRSYSLTVCDCRLLWLEGEVYFEVHRAIFYSIQESF